MRSSFAKCDARVHDCVGLPPEVDNTLDTLPKVIMGELIFYAPIFLIPLFSAARAGSTIYFPESGIVGFGDTFDSLQDL